MSERTTHDVPEIDRHTLELIHERMDLDKHSIASLQDRMKGTLEQAYREMERRYAGHIDRLAQQIGIEIPDGALVEGDTEAWTISVLSGKPGAEPGAEEAKDV